MMLSAMLPSKLFSQFSDCAFDQVGHYNPQLLREWQGRLCWRNLLLTGLASLVVQVTLLFQRLSHLPNKTTTTNHYCAQLALSISCLKDANGWPQIDWPIVCADIFRDLSFLLVWGLVVGGVYLLAADLSKETRRGTLNFLRMSPLPGWQILIGKLLGVPILLYLCIGLMVPMHLSMGLVGSYSLVRVVTFYGLLGAIAFCFYAAALWFALVAKGLQGFQTWLIAGLSVGLLLLGWNLEHVGISADWFHFFQPLYHLADWEVKGLAPRTAWPFSHGQNLNGFRQLGWFSVSLGQFAYGFFAFATTNAVVLGLWFWTVLERKFQMPMNTTLSKQQSYGLTLWLSLIVMGLELQGSRGSSVGWGYAFSMLIWSVLLLFLLLPSKQLLLDWTRYCHLPSQAQSSSRQQAQSSPRQHSLGRDLVFNDGSPFVLAFAINLGIMAGVMLTTAIHYGPNPTSRFDIDLMSWLFISAMLVTCALIVQLIALSNTLHWRWLAFGTVISIVIGLPVFFSMVGANYSSGGFSSYLWLFTVFPQTNVSAWTMGFAMVVHVLFISGLSAVLTRRCQTLGQSEWKALSAPRSKRSRRN